MPEKMEFVLDQVQWFLQSDTFGDAVYPHYDNIQKYKFEKTIIDGYRENDKEDMLLYTRINLKELYCCGGFVNSQQIKTIPHNLINLKVLVCRTAAISYIPNTLVNLVVLNCNDSVLLKEIPNTLVNLEYLFCSSTSVSEIPDTLVKLKNINIANTYVSYIPDTLVFLERISIFIDQNIHIPNNILNNVNIVRFAEM